MDTGWHRGMRANGRGALFPVALALYLFVASTCWASGEALDISSILMRSTFKIEGRNSGNTLTMGTVFVMGKSDSVNAAYARYVLITAAHVLQGIAADTAIVYFRVKNGSEYMKLPFPVRIRENGSPLWAQHPDVDVAAMLIGVPHIADVPLASTHFLATDSLLAFYEIHPGDELNVLGFPYGAEANEAGFPILRSGRIASFPLTPVHQTKTFLLDFEIFEGNSGGPVFLHSENRSFGGRTNIGVVRLVMGVVSKQKEITEKLQSLDEQITRRHNLGLAEIVHAEFVREIMEMLDSTQVRRRSH